MAFDAIELYALPRPLPSAHAERQGNVVVGPNLYSYLSQRGDTMDSSNERFLPEFGVRVFLVEDNPEHSFIAVTVLRQLLGEASEVIVAENAEEALNLIDHFTEHDRPDLMLVDLRLPDNGGF